MFLCLNQMVHLLNLHHRHLVLLIVSNTNTGIQTWLIMFIILIANHWQQFNIDPLVLSLQIKN